MRCRGARHRRGEQKSQWLPFCLSGHLIPYSATAQRHSGYLISYPIGANTSITSTHPTTEDFSHGRTTNHSHFSTPVPEQSPRPKMQHPLPDPMESMPKGGTTPKATLGGPPSPKRWETPPWFKTLKPSHAEAFSWESNMVKEARREFFLKHTYDFTTDGARDLSRTFKYLAACADLLDTSIYKIQSPWTGSDDLKQANYALLSLPKGLKFLRVVPPQNLLRSWDWWVFMTQMPYTTSAV